MITRFNDVTRSIDQLRQQLSNVDAEIDRVESDHRRTLDDNKSKIRTLKNNVRDALEFCDEVRQSISQVQREVSLGGAEHQHPQYGQQLGGLNPQQLAWELTQVITRTLQQVGAMGSMGSMPLMPGANAGQQRGAST